MYNRLGSASDEAQKTFPNYMPFSEKVYKELYQMPEASTDGSIPKNFDKGNIISFTKGLVFETTFVYSDPITQSPLYTIEAGVEIDAMGYFGDWVMAKYGVLAIGFVPADKVAIEQDIINLYGKAKTSVYIYTGPNIVFPTAGSIEGGRIYNFKQTANGFYRIGERQWVLGTAFDLVPQSQTSNTTKMIATAGLLGIIGYTLYKNRRKIFRKR